MPINPFSKTFKYSLLFIVIAEIFSLIGYFYSSVNLIGFIMIAVLAIILSLYNLEHGLLILLAELFIGSMGYLFSFRFGSVSISIRIALWIIVMTAWLGKVILEWARSVRNFHGETNSAEDRLNSDSITTDLKERRLKIDFFKSKFFPYYLILFVFIAWGFVRGILVGNAFHNLFPDFKRWIYYGLAFPVYYVIFHDRGKIREKVSNLVQVFAAAILWLGVKTFILLFIFSHGIKSSEIYHWVRDTGVGEITHFSGGFYRIFFQSHIYDLIGVFIFLLLFAYEYKLLEKTLQFNKKIIVCLLMILISFSAVLISFSRSFWVGLAGDLILFYAYLFRKKFPVKKILTATFILAAIGLLSVGLLTVIVKFPYPKPIGGFDTTDLISERASEVTGEAAVSSRWSLLPKLMAQIEKSPILGRGYGATVTYKSSDPRVIASYPNGEYTTYAFEWGWLDIWLKLGFLGLLAYFALFYKMIKFGLKNSDSTNESSALKIGLLLGLVAVFVVSTFSPYTNHPLGIGYIILTGAFLEGLKEEETPALA